LKSPQLESQEISGLIFLYIWRQTRKKTFLRVPGWHIFIQDTYRHLTIETQ